jgi:hypothetical protein
LWKRIKWKRKKEIVVKNQMEEKKRNCGKESNGRERKKLWERIKWKTERAENGELEKWTLKCGVKK